ncbi:hypothetical protein CCMSSC00406_0001601 [Pleurotus cornucopiae]|uniref:Uncharacterized protein n=1 Tax=Pleurotus cornucopiae TaxID=5321 RepID=A0ACB7IMT0_PLECO|nr:hypothetical protein CCMSSC00406_0001601 [Pleurotus cornucopiae]
MDDASKLEKLITQSKSNDVDIKVDALTKLQALFEMGIEVNDPDAILTVVKASLKTSNNHLTAAAVSVLPAFLPLILSHSVNHHHGVTPSASSSTSSTAPSSVIDVPLLRHVLNQLLPSGGILDRLGDKERVQAKAREALVVLGGFAFRSGGSSSLSSRSTSGKGVETPLMIFERHLKEGGLKSKVWKIREQAILTLVQIRRVHHLFPIRPYLAHLVDALEDTDAHVRDCARQSVVELFTGPGVTDAARADLKKEMIKKSVRKTIVDSVLAKVVGGNIGNYPQSEESDGGEGSNKPKEYVPPSLMLMNRRPTVGNGLNSSTLHRTASQGSAKEMSRPASRAATNASPTPTTPATPASEGPDVQAVYIASTRDLETEFASMQSAFEGKETEHNWAQRERSILRVRGMLKGGVHTRYLDAFIGCLKEGFMQWSLKTVSSLRTTVSMNTCLLYSELAAALEHVLDPFCELLLTNLLKMSSVTKKLTAQQSQASVTTILTKTSAQPRLVLPLLWNTLQEKNVQARGYAIEHFKTYLEVHAQRAKVAIEASGSADILEKAMKKGLVDQNPAVRDKARLCFWQFYEVWKDRGVIILDKLDMTARKQLEKVCPVPDAVQLITPVTTVKKSSVAAAIAASRAKARAIATAPPTLRHQATSAAQSTPARRPSSPSTSPRSSMAPRPASPLRVSTSASPPRSKVTSNGMTRSITTAAITTTHSRQSSSTSGRMSPPSPVSDPSSAFRRRTSSPLASGNSPSPNRNSTVRRAVQVPLPASPPSRSSPSSRNPQARPIILKPLPRPSTTLFDTQDANDSLLLATNIPIPEDDSDDGNDSINLISFSTPFEVYPPASMPTPKSQAQEGPSFSPKSNDSQQLFGISNTLSSGSVDGPQGGVVVVEEAIRARAEQAESAAERLLELVEPDDEGMPNAGIPESLLVGSNGAGHSTPKIKGIKPGPIPISRATPPLTPMTNRNSAIMRQAALFQDSPAPNGKGTSLMGVIHDRKHETGWWVKRMALIRHDSSTIEELGVPSKLDEINSCISAFESGNCDIAQLKRIAMLCRRNPVAEPPLSPFEFSSPTSPSPFLTPANSVPSLQIEIWDKDKNFERLFNALMAFMSPEKSDEEIEYGLIVLWEMMEHQASYLEGREADMFSVLLRVRYCQKPNVLSATNTIRDALAARIEPVYGLTTMHANLRTFLADPYPEFSTAEVRAATYAFGLIALGKFILRLPSEIAEEELPRLKDTLITALNNKSSLVVRESAAATIIAAQLVLRDEAHLFMLLDGLADEKKNLLTYLFDKHGVRGLPAQAHEVSQGPSGVDKLEKEMRRLDTRMNTPPRV